MGPAEDVAVRWGRLREIDLRPAILIPGLVDAHCHLEWSLTGGLIDGGDFAAWLGGLLRLTPRMTPEDHATAALLGALRCLEHGTTTVADSGPTGVGVAALRAAGLRGTVHVEAFGRLSGVQARDAASAIAARARGLDAAAGPLIRVGVSPHAPYTVGPDFWAALVADPDLAGRSWATHLAESPSESRLLTAGDGPLAELFATRGAVPGRWPGAGGPVARLHEGGALRPGLVAAHCVQLDRDDPVRLRDAGVAVAHCPMSNRRLDCGRFPIERLRDAGVTMGLGTDSPASAGDYDVRAEARACGEEHRHLTSLRAGELLRLATMGGAEALGLGHAIGTIETGKRADLVAVMPPPGADGSDPSAAALDADGVVALVMVDGVVALERGVPLTLDRDAIQASASAARARLIG